MHLTTTGIFRSQYQLAVSLNGKYTHDSPIKLGKGRGGSGFMFYKMHMVKVNMHITSNASFVVNLYCHKHWNYAFNDYTYLYVSALAASWVDPLVGSRRKGLGPIAFLWNGSGKQNSMLGCIGSLDFFVPHWFGSGPEWVMLGPRAGCLGLTLNLGPRFRAQPRLCLDWD